MGSFQLYLCSYLSLKSDLQAWQPIPLDLLELGKVENVHLSPQGTILLSYSERLLVGSR